MNWSKLSKKVIKNATKAWAGIDIPYLAPKKTSVVPYILGAFGVAVAGGVAAVMIMSPRTRVKALDIAKDGASKVKGQIDTVGQKLGLQNGEHVNGYSNGLSGEQSAQYQSTGL